MSRIIPNSENRITNEYSSSHKGVDLGWSYNEDDNKIHCNCKGTVYSTLDNIPNGSEQGGGWGNYVLVKHPNGKFSRYAHLKSGLPVSVGDEVDENTVLGIMGDSGRAYGRHLHFEVQTGASSSTRINPTEYLTEPIYTECTNHFNIGDKVIINGSLYVSSDASNPSGSVTNRETTITRYVEGAKHPYNTTGDLGWMDTSSIRLNDEKTYTVQKGDTLIGIASKLGISDWHILYNDNKDVIGDNPNLIQIGMILKY